MIREVARAKVNLCLHVTGQRADGMHLLDSLVVFPDVGDVLEVEPAPVLSLEIDGTFAAGLGTNDNLVLKAARLFPDTGAAISLHKMLPVASGIGGGSADAAATLRAMSGLLGVSLPSTADQLALGADVPVCVRQEPVRMSGIGEQLSPLPALPSFWMVLVNAGEAVPTGAVFSNMALRNYAPVSPVSRFADAAELFDYLAEQRNDMQVAAIGISPAIGAVLDAIAGTEGCALSRMSGSGGTCFGLYATESEARTAARSLSGAHPDWWVVAAPV